MRPANQPTIKDVYLYQKKAGHLASLNHVSTDSNHLFHYAYLHSECFIIDKGCNKTHGNNSIPLTGIQYFKFTHVIKYDRKTHKDTQTK